MVAKSLFLPGFVLAIVLLICHNMALARELPRTNDLKGNVEPAIEPSGLDESKFIGIRVHPQPGIGAGYRGGFQPGFGRGLGDGLGFGPPGLGREINGFGPPGLFGGIGGYGGIGGGFGVRGY